MLPMSIMHFSFMFGHKSVGQSHILFSVNTSIPCATMGLETTSRKIAIKHMNARAGGEVTGVRICDLC